ncbi:hypothetical protein D3C87_691920 [compost metagenome]
MKVVVDGLYVQGAQHHECEDYAVFHADESIQFAAISDGCSGSGHSSVGARLLTLACRQVLLSMEPNERSSIGYQELGKKIISQAHAAASLLYPDSSLLDATLVCAFTDHVKQRVIAMIYGDGGITWKTDNADVEHMWVEYPSGYPNYLSYQLDEGRKQALDAVSEKGMVQSWIRLGKDAENIPMGIQEPTYVILPMEGLQWLMVSSDGLDTFFDSEAGRGLGKEDVVTELSNVKGLHGEFVRRRVTRMLKQYQKQGISHGDDLSVAGLAFIDEQVESA